MGPSNLDVHVRALEGKWRVQLELARPMDGSQSCQGFEAESVEDEAETMHPQPKTPKPLAPPLYPETRTPKP